MMKRDRRLWGFDCHPICLTQVLPPKISLRQVLCTVDCSFDFLLIFRDTGPDESKIKSYLPADKQFLYTKNGNALIILSCILQPVAQSCYPYAWNQQFLNGLLLRASHLKHQFATAANLPNQSVNQSISQSVSQSVSLSVCQSVSQSVSQSVTESIYQIVSHPLCLFVYFLFVCLFICSFCSFIYM